MTSVPFVPTDSIYLISTLFFVAFAGSWHCTVMCGPIVCGLSLRGNLFYYHIGRGISYVGGGAFFGYLGERLFLFSSFPLKVGVALILSLFFIVPWFPRIKMDLGFNRVIWSILRLRPGVFMGGVLSALLPCGWLWTFYAGAAASGSAWAGALVTFALWFSSIPALSLLPQILKTQTRKLNTRRALIVRGVLTIAGVYAIWGHVLFHGK